MDDLAREFNREKKRNAGVDQDVAGGDSSEEFGVFDPQTYVSFDEKVRLAELLKKCKNEKRLTQIVHLLQKD